LQYFGVAGASTPQTQFYFIHATGQKPWTPVEPLTLTRQAGASTRATTQTPSTLVASSTSVPAARAPSQSSAIDKRMPPAPAANSKAPNLTRPSSAAAAQYQPGWIEQPDEEDETPQQGECHYETLVGAYLAGAAGGAFLVLTVLALMLCHRTKAVRADPKGNHGLRSAALAAAQAMPRQSSAYSVEPSDSPSTVPPISRGPTGLHCHARFSEVQQQLHEGSSLEEKTDDPTDNEAAILDPVSLPPNLQSHPRGGTCPSNPCCRRMNKNRSFGMLGTSLPAWIGDGFRGDARPLVLHGASST